MQWTLYIKIEKELSKLLTFFDFSINDTACSYIFYFFHSIRRFLYDCNVEFRKLLQNPLKNINIMLIIFMFYIKHLEKIIMF